MSEPTRQVRAPGSGGETQNPGGTVMVPAGQRVSAPARPLVPVIGVLETDAILLDQYKVVRTIQPQTTDTAGLYLCDDAGLVVVKVYAPERPPDKHLFGRLVNLRHPNLVAIYKTGQVGEHLFEVQEYCGGGTLTGFSSRLAQTEMADWMVRTLLPQVCSALRYLHENNILHLDVKPANILLRSSERADQVVLGDFDIATTVEEGRSLVESNVFKGTGPYVAPEGFLITKGSELRTRMSTRSDYWSLGITCIELLEGTTNIHAAAVGDGSVQDFFMRGGRVEIPRGYPRNLELLLSGMLQQDFRTRWGDTEVLRWISGSNTEEDLRKAASSPPGHGSAAPAASPSYKLGSFIATDLLSLAEGFRTDPFRAQSDLQADSQFLLDWIAGFDTNVARDIRQDKKDYAGAPQLLVEAACWRLDPAQRFRIEGSEYADNMEDFLAWANAQLEQAGSRGLERIGSSDLIDRIALWLSHRPNPDLQLSARVAALGRIIRPDQRADGLLWLLDPARPYVWGGRFSAQTPSEVAKVAYGDNDDWKQGPPASYTELEKDLASGRLVLWLEARDVSATAQKVDEISRRRTAQPVVAMQGCLRYLDSKLPPVKLRFETAPTKRGIVVAQGQSRRVVVRWHTEGPGVPFHAIEKLSGEVSYSPPLINTREGELEVELDATADALPVGRYPARFAFSHSEFVKANPGEIVFNFRVTTAHMSMLGRIAAGALCGMISLGLLRILLSLVVGGAPFTLQRLDVTGIWRDVQAGSFATVNLVIAFVILLAAAYGVFRLAILLIRRWG